VQSTNLAIISIGYGGRGILSTYLILLAKRAAPLPDADLIAQGADKEDRAAAA
jgi:hypothetical protein